MPSLEALSGAQALNDFSCQVARNVESLRSGSVDVNGGIQTTEDLKAHIAEGRNVPFTYSRLIDESRSYK